MGRAGRTQAARVLPHKGGMARLVSHGKAHLSQVPAHRPTRKPAAMRAHGRRRNIQRRAHQLRQICHAVQAPLARAMYTGKALTQHRIALPQAGKRVLTAASAAPQVNAGGAGAPYRARYGCGCSR